ncbi:membrane-tethered transcription factor [Purpureocillium lilacinum]|uniref:Membrane-tethered transcription factor n=1 Tax=Purpureocillium lilacinum TaxID=33203 RepID=A0A179HGY2_PURLI|nr:membrane-tethered transcription factor [Purpureocillium lilacinum]OAQ79881.1 membrane-tethered transcription factor [Purpureocillium lilacinum]OAQ88720.1 membrane-tethered transcription factor [Purpureocillium lilacinum]
MPSGDFHDYDDEFGASNLFDFSNSPDTLQSLETIGTNESKNFLNPQELTASAPDALPDSPNESYHDSSSESASSTKRAGSSASAKTPATTADTAMEDGKDVKMEWANPNYSAFDDEDNAFAFGREADPSVMMDAMYGFGEHDDTFMDRSFDFEGASSSPEAAVGSQINMPSPGMPTIKTTSPKKTAQPNRAKAPNHKKQPSQYSMASSVNGAKTAGSREVSPMSAMVTSHNSSPANTFFNSPSPGAGHDFNKAMNGNAMWPNRLDMAAHANGRPVPVPFGGPVPMPQQQAAMYNAAPFNFTGGYELRIMPTPLKSRVETQIPIKMTLSPLPPGVTKLHLPAHTISKPKLLAKPAPERSPDTLELHVTLVCTSAMEQPGMKQKALDRACKLPQRHLPDLDDENSPQNGGDVRICQGCITRERKRAARKKIKKPDEEKLWGLDEERRVIVFNTQEVKEWQPLSGVMDPNGRPETVASNLAMQIDAPMRIACYCRHHNEKMGFNVIFTIKDFQDRVIAQAMSNPIMITDDHKTHPMTQASSQPAMSEAVTSSTAAQDPATSSLGPPAQNGYHMSPSASDHHAGQRNGQSPSYAASTSGKTTPTMSAATAPTRTMSRPPSPSQGGPLAKKRKSSGSGTRVPNGLTMTRLETSPPPGSQTTSAQLSTATSPFSPNPAAFSQMEQMFGQQPFANGPPTPGSSDQVPFFANNRSASMDNLAMAQLYSAPTSSHPSRAPSPNGLRNGVNIPQNQFAQSLSSSLFALPMGVNQARPPPMIHKIIPNEGPKMGGIEVTVLGQGFFQGLEVWFGDQKATTTTYWGDSSLVCLLPPSPVAGAVAVTFKHQGVPGAQSFPMGKEPPIFKYIDDNEDKLIRTALSVLGHKMSGQMVDVSDLARRILNDGSSTWAAGPSGGQTSGGPGFNHAASHEHLESQLLKVLDLIDLDDSTHKTRLDLKRPTGHTMLHLACSLGYHRFVAALLARGANPDARDKGGFTPLHVAAINNHPEIVRRLMLVGADPTIRSLSSLTAADVAQSRQVLRAIRQSERHARSFSGGSLHSRTSSATSLRSLWEPMTRAHTHDEPIAVDGGEESPEYTSGDFEDEDPDEDLYMHMRRQSRVRGDVDSTDHLGDDSDEEIRGPGSPTTQFAALKDQLQQQFHQLQQSMALHLQSLPQMPQIPTFPGMPLLPDYQAYLQQAPFMRRMQQLMPGGSGARPDSQDGGNPKMDSRWWDLSSYMQNGAQAPPAYEEIFGRQDSDTKQESAIRAAADAEADIKCTSLYDQPSTSAAAEARTITRATSPGILKIGRKNAITKEQQEQFLAAHEKKLKNLSSDRNLFFIWIPLLLVMVCAMLYSYFPSLFPFLWSSARALVQVGQTQVARLVPQGTRAPPVEV